MLDIPVKSDGPVVRVGEWQSEQPIDVNRLAPLRVDAVDAVGVGGADKRMKTAKFTISEDISEAVPIVLPKFELPELPFRMLVASSGDPLKTHPATALRSLGKSSFETPCSTF